MKNYEKPIALANSELAEGVFMDSGGEVTTDCWDVDAVSVQDWNGSHHVFEVRCSHSTKVVHISSQTVVTLVFNAPLTDAYSEFTSSFNGNTVTVTRELLADAYNSGDTMTYKVWAKAADEATTKALKVNSAGISCTHAVNVQGGFD